MKSLILIALALHAPFSWAAEEPLKLPPAAQAILDTAERAISANRAKYDDANKKPLADAEKALKAEQDRLAKAGKLEEALAVKKLLDSFRDELVAKVDEKAKEKGDLLGQREVSPAKMTPKEMLSWARSTTWEREDGYTITWDENGFSYTGRGVGRINGRYESGTFLSPADRVVFSEYKDGSCPWFIGSRQLTLKRNSK